MIKSTGIIIFTIIISFLFSSSVNAEDVSSETEFISDIQLPETVLTESALTESVPLETVSYNYILSVAIQELINRLEVSAAENNYEISFPDDFNLVVGGYINSVLTTESDLDLYREAFIQFILAELGITPDNPFYEIAHDVVGQFYDDLVGADDQADESALLVGIFSSVSIISVLGIIKWIK